MFYEKLDKLYNIIIIKLIVIEFKISNMFKKRDTSKYNFGYDSDGKPTLHKKDYGTKDV